MANLPLEVQRARAAYLQDSSIELAQLYGELGVVSEHEDRPEHDRTVSLDAMIERGYEFDSDGNVYEPRTWDDD